MAPILHSCLRRRSSRVWIWRLSEAVIAANARQIGTAPAATYTRGPVRDYRLIPDNPYALFKAGQFNKSVKVLAADNSSKGEVFFDADHSSNEDFFP
ncbi:hypothetical protein Forpe1208_v001926 [Fusarium oxysporum f. sp. rapae]|uniref:Uncharacterized protein n=1 Tax=Fusarium oxysporum f. sp. rapae TaxID=485398 RepID=A0A8J5PJ30_FUSOX|nr:hypothetical protein Forpe1208_v001926 [Fusarium oxysporum f. sp. rapae]